MSGAFSPFQLTGPDTEPASGVEWNAGTVTALGGSLAINAGVLSDAWNAGTVASLGGGLTVNGGVLADQWSGGTVTTLSTGLLLSSGTLTAPPLPWLNNAAGVPALANFTQVGIGGTTSISQSTLDQIISLIDSGANTTALRGLLYTAPATPYRIAILVCNNAGPNSNRALAWGFCDGTKYQVVLVANAYQATPNLANWSSATTYVSQVVKTEIVSLTGAGDIWLGCHNDGTNIYYEFSTDGVNFVTVAEVTISGGYLSSIASVFIGVDYNSAANPSALSIQCFDPNGLNRTFP